MMQTVVRFVTSRRLTRNQTTAAAEDEVYDKSIRVLHWLMAGGIMPCVGLVLAAQKEKDNAKKGQLMFWHKSIGLSMLALVVPRVYLSFVRKAPGPLPNHNPLTHYAGVISHKLFYGLMVFLPVSGVVMGYYGGRGLPFFVTTIPGAQKADPATAKSAWLWHKRAGQVLEYLIPLHIGGFAYHALRGERIFQRINPFYKAIKA